MDKKRAATWQSEAARLQRAKRSDSGAKAKNKSFLEWLGDDERRCNRTNAASRILLNIADFFDLLNTQFPELKLGEIDNPRWNISQTAIRKLRRLWPALPPTSREACARALVAGQLTAKFLEEYEHNFASNVPAKVTTDSLSNAVGAPQISLEAILQMLFTEAAKTLESPYQLQHVRTFTCLSQEFDAGLNADAFSLLRRANGQIVIAAGRLIRRESDLSVPFTTTENHPIAFNLNVFELQEQSTKSKKPSFSGAHRLNSATGQPYLVGSVMVSKPTSNSSLMGLIEKRENLTTFLLERVLGSKKF